MKMHPSILCLLAASAVSLDGQTSQTTQSVSQSTEGTAIVSQHVEEPKITVGKLSSVDPSRQTLTLSSEDSAGPIRYIYTEKTRFFDEQGNALTPESMLNGSNIAVTYLQAGTSLVIVKAVATKPVDPVVVHMDAPSNPPTIIIKKIVVKPEPAAPMVEESTTTTTTTGS